MINDTTPNISTGEPSTLKTYRGIAVALAGEQSKAVEFFDDKIKESTNGENEIVIAHETQVLFLIASMMQQDETK